MTTLKKFISYVELRTKITSVFPFFMALAYLFYRKQSINARLTLVFFGSMLLFDLTTTAINNYMDTKTNEQILPFRRSTAKTIIFILFAVSLLLGLYLAYSTDVVVLLLGGLCFLFGVLYSYGPIPFSRQPLGEVFSGFFYGLLIPFIVLYVNMPKGTFLSLAFDSQTIRLNLNIFPIFTVLLLSVAPVCATANIMLANNICDVEKDVQVKRYTLPYYLGGNALSVFANLYYISYIATVAMVIFKVLPPVCLLSLLTIFPIRKNIARFVKKQDKEETFVLSVQNFMILIGVNSLFILIGGVLS